MFEQVRLTGILRLRCTEYSTGESKTLVCAGKVSRRGGKIDDPRRFLASPGPDKERHVVLALPLREFYGIHATGEIRWNLPFEVRHPARIREIVFMKMNRPILRGIILPSLHGTVPACAFHRTGGHLQRRAVTRTANIPHLIAFHGKREVPGTQQIRMLRHARCKQRVGCRCVDNITNQSGCFNPAIERRCDLIVFDTGSKQPVSSRQRRLRQRHLRSPPVSVRFADTGSNRRHGQLQQRSLAGFTAGIRHQHFVPSRLLQRHRYHQPFAPRQSDANHAVDDVEQQATTGGDRLWMSGGGCRVEI